MRDGIARLLNGNHGKEKEEDQLRDGVMLFKGSTKVDKRSTEWKEL